MKIIDTITINSPVGEVFKVFTDLDNANKNISAITKIKVLEGPSKMAPGTKWRETRTMFGKEATEEMWVGELTKNKSYTIEADSRGAKYRTDYTFTEKDGKTDVAMVFDCAVDNPVANFFMNIMFLLMKSATKKQLRNDLVDLKTACEK